MQKTPLRVVPQVRPERPRIPVPRRPVMAGPGRSRKIAFLGGAPTLRWAPWHDSTWELWAHHSCRNQCLREPDAFFDLHPPVLWRDPKKKFWDPRYLTWLGLNRTPIYMQEAYKDAPAAIRYPFESVITEFPRGYFTNTVSWMMALALTEGMTHVGLFGCNYDASSEYGPQRGCCEYWLGLAEGRGVHIHLPPGCDLLNRPSLLYGYESHKTGWRDPSYSFAIGMSQSRNTSGKSITGFCPEGLTPSESPDAPSLMDIGQPPALHRRDAGPQENN